MEDKKYELPEEVLLFIDRYFAMSELRDKCIKSPFGFRRAKKCAINATTFRRKFWSKVNDLYPELSNFELIYDHKLTCVKIKKEN